MLLMIRPVVAATKDILACAHHRWCHIWAPSRQAIHVKVLMMLTPDMTPCIQIVQWCWQMPCALLVRHALTHRCICQMRLLTKQSAIRTGPGLQVPLQLIIAQRCNGM